MPRAKSVVMDKHDPAELHRSAIKKAVKLHSPYEVVDGELLSQEEDLYYVVYRAPLGGDRKVIAGRNKKANALKLRDMLNEAWAQGFWSSGRV